MRRDLQTYVYDIRSAGEHIQAFTDGMALEDYQTSELVRSAVERKFAVIGEALVRIRAGFPETFGRISDAEKIIGFRNVLVHGYDMIDDATVWSAIEANLPVLLREIAEMETR